MRKFYVVKKVKIMRFGYATVMSEQVPRPLQRVEQSVVSLLGLVVAVKEQRVGFLAPAVLVGYTPDSDTNALGHLREVSPLT
jgi:hypothetical protein